MSRGGEGARGGHGIANACTAADFEEFNATYLNRTDITDGAFMAAWLAETIRRCDGLVQDMAYWTFSDVFEEAGVVQRPFYGGYGLLAAGHIPKPAFNAFALLHKLGEERYHKRLTGIAGDAVGQTAMWWWRSGTTRMSALLAWSVR